MSGLGQKKSKALGFVSSIWQFEGSGGPAPYRWYGTLPEQLIERVLDLYAPESSKFLDPFAGTGTSLNLALKRGLEVSGLDVNPLACLISNLRLQNRPKESELEKSFNRIISNQRGKFDDFFADARFEYSRKWWRSDSLVESLSLFNAICDEKDPVIQSIFFVAASQKIRDVANIDSRCTHHLVTKKKEFIDIKSGLRKQIDKVVESMNSENQTTSRVLVQQADSTDINLDIGEFDLVFAHPPYLGMINYHLIHRLQTDILHYVSESRSPVSLSDLNFENSSIKSRDVSTDSENKYSKFVARFAEKMNTVIKHGGKCVVIIGDQRNKGNIRHPFTTFISEFEKLGFFTKEIFIWILQNNAGMHISRRGNFIDHNYILVFEKPKED